MSSLLPGYSNSEADRVRDAFQAANFASLDKLPALLAPDTVLAASQHALQRNLAAPRAPPPAHRSLKQHGLFHAFEYVPSPYGAEAARDGAARAASAAAMAQVAGGVDPFSGEVYYAPFSGHGAASAGARGKHEAAFPRPCNQRTKDLHPDENVYPYMANVFADAHDASVRAAWAHDAKVLNAHGAPFVPPGKRRTGAATQSLAGSSVAEGPTRALLPDVVKSVHGCLAEDWPDANFTVTADPADGDAIHVRVHAREGESDGGDS